MKRSSKHFRISFALCVPRCLLVFVAIRLFRMLQSYYHSHIHYQITTHHSFLITHHSSLIILFLHQLIFKFPNHQIDPYRLLLPVGLLIATIKIHTPHTTAAAIHVTVIHRPFVKKLQTMAAIMIHIAIRATRAAVRIRLMS